MHARGAAAGPRHAHRRVDRLQSVAISGNQWRTGGGESIEATARECDCEDRVTHTGSSGADGGPGEGGDGVPACNQGGSSARNQGGSSACNQWPSVPISGHPRQLVAIRGHQRSSGVISRHQRTVRVRDSTNRKVPQYPRRSWQVGGAPPLQPGLWRSDYRGCCCCCCCCLWHRRRRLHLRPLGGDR